MAVVVSLAGATKETYVDKRERRFVMDEIRAFLSGEDPIFEYKDDDGGTVLVARSAVRCFTVSPELV